MPLDRVNAILFLSCPFVYSQLWPSPELEPWNTEMYIEHSTMNDY